MQMRNIFISPYRQLFTLSKKRDILLITGDLNCLNSVRENGTNIDLMEWSPEQKW